MFGACPGAYQLAAEAVSMQTLPRHTRVIEWRFSHLVHSFSAWTYVHAETHVGLAHTHQLLLISLRSDFFFRSSVKTICDNGTWPVHFPFPCPVFLYYHLIAVPQPKNNQGQGN